MTNGTLRFDNRVVVITGAGGGLGKMYAHFFASRGASLVINDYGVSLKGESASSSAADKVVDEIVKAGGRAVANYDSVEDGEKIIKTAIDAFGRVDILINNAGILRDKSFINSTDVDWDLVCQVHLNGAFKVTHAAWPIFRAQKFGRIINTTSPAGIYGNFGQASYSAAKHALIAFSDTLSQEGNKYNILCNTISPLAASRLTETSMPAEMLEVLDPKYIVPVVAFLSHETTTVTGGLFEAAGGFINSVRWELANGAIFKPDSTFTPAAVASRYHEITDFNSGNKYPNFKNGVDYLGLMKQAMNTSASSHSNELSFDGKVVVITGSGAGLGLVYAKMFAKYGAKVLINDVGRSKDGKYTADIIANQINSSGGIAAADHNSVENGEAVINSAIKAFGKIDVVINNAGILRDKSFIKMSVKDWYDVYNVHLRGTYKVSKAAWPHFLKQKSGIILNTSSSVGLYGNFGQCNYSSAKGGIIGLSKTLAIEGAKHGIRVNCIAPNAGTAMTATVFPPEIVELLKPDYVAPFVGFLCHSSCKDTGKMFQVGSCWAGEVRRQSTGGYVFPQDDSFTPEAIRDKWSVITNFDDGRAVNTKDIREFTTNVITTLVKLKSQNKKKLPRSAAKIPSKLVDVAAARNHKYDNSKFEYTTRDVMLYSVGIGATRMDLPLVYENSSNFHTFPTFAVIPEFFVPNNMNDYLPEYNPMMLLHGEEFIEIHSPIPTSGSLVCTPEIVDIVDKVKGATVINRVTMRCPKSNNVVAVSESTFFIRGIGGFSKHPEFKPVPSPNRNPIAALDVKTPQTRPDCIYSQKTNPDQAVVYRLSGDYNPLHIDPEMAAFGDFDQPILHGLCTMGYTVRHVVKCAVAGRSLSLKSVKVRFSSPIYPGETIETLMWKSPSNSKIVLFGARVVERDLIVLSNGIAEFTEDISSITAPASETSKL
ncbi:Peroxisomal hydratase-dehydrogenase-epimerase [Smittium culicis]|uniref:Peroxisomal hydratase-dehydrogenase-epimerase n=1 Tax=Smittium culicis TaxID=133412 RepID=A0A1R1XJE5_9FUNG|nr:Peroxisomal hydratase-dehydrogenase-epimerase [Smittium culicis]OMJ14718.1 Peroxisomal hydratase-dehydrogenase-epimerase [Smittium culicis]